jgi:tRNA uracil 4-sulfurtransferase
MLKRGITQDYVFCNLGGDAYERAVVQVGKLVADDWSYGTRPRLHVIDFQEPLRALREGAGEVLAGRAEAAHVPGRVPGGAELGAQAIITGEAVGQVSSQTLSNLRAIEPAADLPVFRPLLGFDKDEIIDRARLIGTAGLSEQVKEYCAIAPGRPVTAATVEAVAAEEDEGGSGDGRGRRRRPPRPGPAGPHAHRPGGALPLHRRGARRRSRPGLPSRVRVPGLAPPGRRATRRVGLLRKFNKLDRDRRYVLYCGHGIQTAHIAEKMQRAGYEAYSFRGGVRAMRDWVAAEGPGRG